MINPTKLNNNKMKVIKRLLVLPACVLWLVVVLLMVLLLIITWVPLGVRPAEWFDEKVVNPLIEWIETMK